MNYYDEQESKSRLYGAVATVLYCIALGAAMLWVNVKVPAPVESEMMIIEIEEMPQEKPKPVISSQAPRHEHLSSTTQNSQQVTDTDTETRTVNSRALFHSNKGGVDEPEDLGNPYAKQADENKASGTGGGLNTVGNDQLDEGLRGRGLVGSLPVPSYPGNTGGKIVIRVAVNQHGQVTSAAYEPKGSTSSDAALIAAAIEAAKRARFTESRSFMQGGTITYNFKLN